MPIRPENAARYGPDWAAITFVIKVMRALGRCECRGECRRPDYHLAGDGRCGNLHGQPAAGTGSLVVLTTAHLDHQPENMHPANLRAMCQGCHLHYDRDHHAESRRARRHELLTSMGIDPLPGLTGDPA